MGIYGGALKTEATGSQWAVTIPAGLAGQLQIIGVYFGLGTVNTPSGWTLRGQRKHQFEDVNVAVFTRVLAANWVEGPVNVSFSTTSTGVAVASSWANADLADAVVTDEGPFSTTFTRGDVTAIESGFVLDFIGRKDSRSLVSWPDTTVMQDAFIGGPSNASGTAGYRTVVPGSVPGKTITIQNAYDPAGPYQTAPFVSATMLLRGTAATRIQASGGGIIPDAIGVATLAIGTPLAFAVGATRDVVVTLTGTDGSPVVGAQVTAVAPSVASVDSENKTTDGAGQVTFTLTGLFAGDRQFTVSASGQSASVGVSVTGASVSIAAVDVSITAGNTATVNLTAINADGSPMASQSVSFALAGVTVTPVTQNLVTDAGGKLSYAVQADTAGQFTLTATVSGTTSLPVTITVNPVIVGSESIRIRGLTIPRITPLLR